MVPAGAARRGRPHGPSPAVRAAVARAPSRGPGFGGRGRGAGGGSSAAPSRALSAGSATQRGGGGWRSRAGRRRAAGSGDSGDGGAAGGRARAGGRAAHVTQTRAPHRARGGAGRRGDAPPRGPGSRVAPQRARGGGPQADWPEGASGTEALRTALLHPAQGWASRRAPQGPAPGGTSPAPGGAPEGGGGCSPRCRSFWSLSLLALEEKAAEQSGQRARRAVPGPGRAGRSGDRPGPGPCVVVDGGDDPVLFIHEAAVHLLQFPARGLRSRVHFSLYGPCCPSSAALF